MENLKIYLFRHGQTSFNKNKIFTGWKNPKLTPLGKKQAKIISNKLKNKKIDIAFQTKLSRSKDTLKIVLQAHPECKKIITDNRMIERSYGDLEGTKHEAFIEKMGKRSYDLISHGDSIGDLEKKEIKEIERLLGENEYRIIHRGYNIAPPNGESFADVEKRVKEFIKYLKKFMKKEKVNVCISAHGNSIRLFRKIMENASKEQAIKWIIPYDKYFEYNVNYRKI
jgi:2,3-bisphosphoglycerate-dependent phosphoglycerate mutase